MKIEPITSPAFAAYGKALEGYDAKPLLDTLNTATPLPEGWSASRLCPLWRLCPLPGRSRTTPTAECPFSWDTATAITPG